VPGEEWMGTRRKRRQARGRARKAPRARRATCPLRSRRRTVQTFEAMDQTADGVRQGFVRLRHGFGRDGF
jgi:hypothetical protein